MLAATCPHCGSNLELADELAGKETRCVQCQADFLAPAAAAPPIARPSTHACAPLAALLGFLVGMLGIGVMAWFWVAAQLAPPLPLSAAPLRPGNRDRFDVRKDFGFRPKAKFRDRRRFDERKDGFADGQRIGGPIVQGQLPVGPDGRAFVMGRLEPPLPNDAGLHAQDGPVRLYHVMLVQDRRYNVAVDAREFAPRLRVYFDGDDLPVASRTELPDARRSFLSFQANRTGLHVIQVTRTGGPGNDFDLSFAPMTVGTPERIQLATGQTLLLPRRLQVHHGVDLAAPEGHGPYCEYLLPLEAGSTCEIKVLNASFPAVLRVYDQDRLDKELSGAQNLSALFRAPRAGLFRIRVTSSNRGLGDYALQVARRS